jgi:type I restriction enzyme S subunit
MSRSRAEWTRVRFGDVVRLSTERCTDPVAHGIDRYVGLEHLEPSDLRIRSWGNVAEGVTFTNRFRPGQVLFGKRRAYQRKVAVAEFDGICSSDIYVFEPADDRLIPSLLPFICQTDGFFEHAIKTSAGSLSPRTNWTSLADYEFDLPPVAEQSRMAAGLHRILVTEDEIREVICVGGVAVSSYLEYAIGPMVSSGCEQAPGRSVPLVTLEDACTEDAPICYGIVQVGQHDEAGVPTLAIHSFRSLDGVHRTAIPIESRYARSRIQGGDILVSVKGTVGLIGVVPDSFQGNISRDLARIRLDNKRLANDWLLAVWSTPSFQRRLRSVVVGSTRAELSIAALRSLRVPVPSLAIQAAVCARWRQLCGMNIGAVARRRIISQLRKRILQGLAS